VAVTSSGGKIQLAELPTSVMSAGEKALGSVSGKTPLNLAEGSTFTATLTGATEFEPANLPTLRENGSLWVTQDATGGHLWSIAGLNWIGSEPVVPTSKGVTVVLALFVLGGKLYAAMA
jgi:hypothetical protein